jgi:hypothetical protein
MSTLTEITQEQYNTAEATVIDLLRAAYPNLDLRRGTVLRDLLLRAGAQITARDTNLMAELQGKQSLLTLAENEATADADDINAVLANFNMARLTGTKAAGTARILVSADRTYTVPEGFKFVSVDGLEFELVTTTVASSTPDTSAGNVQLYTSDDGTYYYFFVEVIAVEPGAASALVAGSALDVSAALYGFVSAETYSSFTSGTEDETITEAIARLPAAVSYRALESRTSIEAKLRDAFDGGAFTIEDIAVRGYGDSAQLRDKHNPMGFAIGSRVDIYAKTFTRPNRVLIQKTGTLIGVNTYQIDLAAADVPGFYAIRSVSDIEQTTAPAVGFGELPTLGSYAFSEVRSSSGVNDTFHDIDKAVTSEIAFSVWQKSVVVVTGVPSTDAAREFKVELYTAPGLVALQDYVDSSAIRNLEADYVIRCPLICMVEVQAIAYYSAAYPIDLGQMKTNLAALINTRPFGYTLTRSEITNQMISDGATRIDLSHGTGMELKGQVIDGNGIRHELTGDALDIRTVEDTDALLVPETVVFGVEEDKLSIEVIAE